MRDVFFTILTVWLIWRIYNSFQSAVAFRKKEDEMKIKRPSGPPKQKDNDEGEYVDYEEIK